MMWLSRKRNTRDDRPREAALLHRVSRKLHLWGQAMAGMDDPLGDYLLRLEERVRRLEGEVQQLRGRPSASTVAADNTSNVALK